MKSGTPFLLVRDLHHHVEDECPLPRGCVFPFACLCNIDVFFNRQNGQYSS